MRTRRALRCPARRSSDHSARDVDVRQRHDRDGTSPRRAIGSCARRRRRRRRRRRPRYQIRRHRRRDRNGRRSRGQSSDVVFQRPPRGHLQAQQRRSPIPAGVRYAGGCGRHRRCSACDRRAARRTSARERVALSGQLRRCGAGRYRRGSWVSAHFDRARRCPGRGPIER